ncbi:MAG: hypothetical protein C0507_25430 [Cyanobacteria bacterium PR.3.49]|nr:hypothetical protein [Cyanobacteria bacterium PR.3.49]
MANHAANAKVEHLPEINSGQVEQGVNSALDEVYALRRESGSFNHETQTLGGQMMHGAIAGTELHVESNSRGPEPALLIKDAKGAVVARVKDGALSFANNDHQYVTVQPGGKRNVQQLLWK